MAEPATDAARKRGRGRLSLMAAGGLVGFVICYLIVCLAFLGLVWPVPLLLPGSFNWRGTRYERTPQCWASPQAAEAVLAQPPVRVGTLQSALWFGDQPIYSYEPGIGWPAQPREWLLVPDKACLREYVRYVND
jgi:hypothetical protein